MNAAHHNTLHQQDITINTSDGLINGILVIPIDAKAVIIFAHGTGSSRLSPRNKHVADILNQNGLATLQMDLLTEQEERLDMVTGQLRFDIDFLARRLNDVMRWIVDNPSTHELKPAYFGASTGAAAALVAAAQRPQLIRAVVSRGGRPDMAEDILGQVKAPTLLIVGSLDRVVLDLNRKAFEKLQTAKELIVVPGASHLFEEPGTLDQVARHAKEWFMQYAL